MAVRVDFMKLLFLRVSTAATPGHSSPPHLPRDLLPTPNVERVRNVSTILSSPDQRQGLRIVARRRAEERAHELVLLLALELPAGEVQPPAVYERAGLGV